MAKFQDYSKPKTDVSNFEKLIKQWKRQAMENREKLAEKEFFKKKSVIKHEKAVKRKRAIAKNKAKMALFNK